MLKLKNTFILASMNYFDSDMSKSTNTVVYFDWKTGIYIYVCGICRTQFTVIEFSSGSVAHASENWFGPVTFANFFQ
jgi:hypothetical protein